MKLSDADPLEDSRVCAYVPLLSAGSSSLWLCGLGLDFLSLTSSLSFPAYQLRVCQPPAPVTNAEILTDDAELEIGKFRKNK